MRSDEVSVYVRLILANTPSQGLVILYDEPLSEVNWKLIAVLPLPFRSMSFASSSNSPKGMLEDMP